MKSIFLPVFLFLNSIVNAAPMSPQVDTVDFWHVFYNYKLIKQYNGYNFGDALVFKIDSIKSGDSITVKFFRDTPSSNCNAYLIVEYPILSRALIAHGTYTFCPLTISLTDLKNFKEMASYRQMFEVYYLEDSNDNKIKLFDIKLE